VQNRGLQKTAVLYIIFANKKMGDK